MSHPLFARQAIFDQALQVYAYELLFRGEPHAHQAGFDGDKASSHVLLHAFGERDIQDITGHKSAFINFTRNLLVCPPPLPSHQLVIEILEDITPDAPLLRSLGFLKAQGYRLALDDFVLTEHSEQFLPFADYIKVDVLGLDKKQIQAQLQALKSSKAKLIAEKIETPEQFAICKSLGFDFFQGYFLAKPQLIAGQKNRQDTTSVLQLLSAITNHQNDFKAIAAALAGEPSLSYRLMKMVNSTAFGARRRVESLNQAIALAGLERIRNWATLLLLAGNHQKPTELCTLSSARAKFCEKLASHTANIDPQQAFTLGLLSMLDAHLDLSMATILQQLHLSPSLENALLGADSSGLSLLLKTCAALESQRFSDLPLGSLRALGIDETHINSAYTEALCFADQFNRL